MKICTDFTLVSLHIVTVSTDDHSLVDHLVWLKDCLWNKLLTEDRANFIKGQGSPNTKLAKFYTAG